MIMEDTESRWSQGREEARNGFKLSGHPQMAESSMTQVQHARTIAHMQLQAKFTSIFDIFALKVLTRTDHAFNMIRTAEDHHLSSYAQQRYVQQLVSGFMGKLQAFIAVRTVKQMGSFMGNLKGMSNRGRNENSKREMLRVNSRLERDYDDFQLDRNHSHQGNSERTNKMLHKRKEKNQKEIATFKLQMEQLLSQHEGYLRKKN